MIGGVWLFLAGLGSSAALTALVIPLARRWGVVAAPRVDRWHRRPTALLGGVAVMAAFGAVSLSLVPIGPETVLVLGVAAAAFAIGLWDDLRPLRPIVKLIAQIALGIGLAVGLAGLGWWPVPAWLAAPLTVAWLVLIINAFNIIDNMDGLCAGVALVVAGCCHVIAGQEGLAVPAALAAVLAGNALGFLLFNFHPARIFLGDAGSLTLGASLAVLSLVVGWRSMPNLLLGAAIPLGLMAVPLFDVLLVSAQRLRHGRSIAQGGRDHASHRLVGLGLSERRAVLILIGVSLAFGLAVVASPLADPTVVVVLLGLLGVALLMFGLFLGGVPVYGPGSTIRVSPAWATWRAVPVALADGVLLAMAHVLAYVIRFEGHVVEADLNRIQDILPLLVPLKLWALALAGGYRGVGRRFEVKDLMVTARGLLAGSLLVVLAVLFLYRFEGYSRTLFLLDLLLAGILILLVRLAPRLLRHMFRSAGQMEPLGVLVAGSPEQQRLLSAVLAFGPERRFRVLAAGDPASGGEDPAGLAELIRSVGVRGVVAVEPGLTGPAPGDFRLQRHCEDLGVPMYRLRIHWDGP